MTAGPHDFLVYHGRIECHQCMQSWCCQAQLPFAGGCHGDAPILYPHEFKEIEPLRIAFTDGEMSNLQADFGQLLCASVCEFRPLTDRQLKAGQRPWTNLRTFTLGDYANKRWDDRSLAVEWRDALQEYDIIVTWNGIKFDIPFLNTRLGRWGEKELSGGVRHKDLMYTARYKLRLASASLDNVATFLNLHEKYGVKKTRMEPERWTMALGGHLPSFRYILHHCELDVRVLAGAWQETKHLVTEIK
jgi:DNA polymerase elongation subunit (family B)